MFQIVFFGIALVTGFHALFTNCELMLILAFACIGLTLLVDYHGSMPAWLRHIFTGVVFGVLGFIACASALQYQLYWGRLAEYGYLTVEALLAIAMFFLFVLPSKQKTAA